MTVTPPPGAGQLLKSDPMIHRDPLARTFAFANFELDWPLRELVQSAFETRPIEAAYACRNVRMGSTFAARAAGIHAASRHTATIRPRLAR